MTIEPKSEGVCLFCNTHFSKAGINRHLAGHLKSKTPESKSGNSFLLKIESNPKYGNVGYFLSL